MTWLHEVHGQALPHIGGTWVATIAGLEIHVENRTFYGLSRMGVLEKAVERFLSIERDRLAARGLELAPGSTLCYVDSWFAGDIGVVDL